MAGSGIFIAGAVPTMNNLNKRIDALDIFSFQPTGSQPIKSSRITDKGTLLSCDQEGKELGRGFSEKQSKGVPSFANADELKKSWRILLAKIVVPTKSSARSSITG